MLKIFWLIIKKVITAVLFIYAYNKLALPLNIIIPINYFTVILVAFGGIPAILMMVMFSLVCI